MDRFVVERADFGFVAAICSRVTRTLRKSTVAVLLPTLNVPQALGTAQAQRDSTVTRQYPPNIDRMAEGSFAWRFGKDWDENPAFLRQSNRS